MPNNDVQITIETIKDRAKRTPLKTEYELMCSGRISSSCSICGTSCYSCYKPVDKSWMSKGLDCDCDKRNIFVVICDTDLVMVNQVMMGSVKPSKW